MFIGCLEKFFCDLPVHPSVHDRRIENWVDLYLGCCTAMKMRAPGLHTPAWSQGDVGHPVLSMCFYSDVVISGALPRVFWFLELVNDSLQAYLSQANHPILSPHSNNLLYWAVTYWVLFTCPPHPRTRYQTPRDSPYTPGPPDIIQTSRLRPTHPASPIPSHRNHHKASVHIAPHPLCLLPHLGAGPGEPPPPGVCERDPCLVRGGHLPSAGRAQPAW